MYLFIYLRLTLLAQMSCGFTVVLWQVFTSAANRVWPVSRNILIGRTATPSHTARKHQGALRGNDFKICLVLFIPA